MMCGSLKAMNTVPQNCRECTHAADCKSWYGGTQCKYRDDIPKEKQK